MVDDTLPGTQHARVLGMGNDKKKTTQQTNELENEKKTQSSPGGKSSPGAQPVDPRQKASDVDSGGNADAVEGDATSKDR